MHERAWERLPDAFPISPTMWEEARGALSRPKSVFHH